jgi:hypothetical protein
MGLTQSGTPIAGFAVLVCNGHNQKIVAILRVDQAIGKSPQATAANLRCEWVPGCGVLLYKLYRPECFNQESVSQARRLFCVPSDGVIKFGPRWL